MTKNKEKKVPSTYHKLPDAAPSPSIAQKNCNEMMRRVRESDIWVARSWKNLAVSVNEASAIFSRRIRLIDREGHATRMGGARGEQNLWKTLNYGTASFKNLCPGIIVLRVFPR